MALSSGPARDPALVVAKAALRGPARAARDAMPADERAAASAAITATVDAEVLAPLPAGALLCLYDAFATEVATRPIAELALARGLQLVYPRIRRGGLHLALHRATPATLRPGVWGIGEPAEDAPEVNPREVDVVLMPGLLFDRAGNRLGFGKGHYDATFSAAPDRLRVGLAFDRQLVDELPAGAHDLRVHLLVTERGVLRPRLPMPVTHRHA